MSGSESITTARTAAITAAVISLLTTFGAFRKARINMS
jgi:hypothetical protein